MSSSARLAIAIDETTIIVWVQSKIRRFVEQNQGSSKDAWTLAIVVSEAVTNIQKFGRRGAIELVSEPDAIVLVAEDVGPGLPNVETALRDGISEGVDLTAADAPRGKRRGLGTGLGAIQRLMSELSIEHRPDRGTRLVARYRLGRDR